LHSDPKDPVRLLVLEGDGIGSEICAAALKVIEAVEDIAKVKFSLDNEPIGLARLRNRGATIDEEVINKARQAEGVILGPVSHNAYPPASQGGLNPSGELRKHLDLYANIRPARSRPGFPPRCGSSIDVVIVRENTEGFYADRNMFLGSGEFMPSPDMALAVRKITRPGCLRIVRAGFKLARNRRRKLTAVHKANVLRVSDGLFLECARIVAEEFSEVTYEEKIIDAMAALLIRDASQFDVIVTTNMFGDILSDEASEISGSLGLAASLTAGTHHAMAQAQHGSAPDIAGKGIANPSSLISSTGMLLAWIGERRRNPDLISIASLIEAGLDEVIGAPDRRTPDLGGKISTSTFTDHVVTAMKLRSYRRAVGLN
jgi:3-isopropylmalate dehydrogenase